MNKTLRAILAEAMKRQDEVAAHIHAVSKAVSTTTVYSYDRMYQWMMNLEYLRSDGAPVWPRSEDEARLLRACQIGMVWNVGPLNPYDMVYLLATPEPPGPQQ